MLPDQGRHLDRGAARHTYLGLGDRVVMDLQTRPEDMQAEDLGTGRLETDEDSLLVAALRRGSEAAFLTLVQRHEGAMLRIARLHVATTASAEDVVQETWVAVLKGIGGFDGRASLTTWMYRILTNRAKTMGTRERRSTPDTAAVTRELDHVDPAVPADRFLDALDTAWPGHWKQPPLLGKPENQRRARRR